MPDFQILELLQFSREAKVGNGNFCFSFKVAAIHSHHWQGMTFNLVNFHLKIFKFCKIFWNLPNFVIKFCSWYLLCYRFWKVAIDRTLKKNQKSFLPSVAYLKNGRIMKIESCSLRKVCSNFMIRFLKLMYSV